jgi:transposase
MNDSVLVRKGVRIMQTTESRQDQFVGIDVSKATLDVDIYPQSQPQSFGNDEAGRRAALAALRCHSPTLIVVGATSGLETALVAMLVADGIPVAVFNPRQARDFAKALVSSPRRIGRMRMLARFA